MKRYVILDPNNRPIGSFSDYKEAHDYCYAFAVLRNINCRILDRLLFLRESGRRK